MSDKSGFVRVQSGRRTRTVVDRCVGRCGGGGRWSRSRRRQSNDRCGVLVGAFHVVEEAVVVAAVIQMMMQMGPGSVAQRRSRLARFPFQVYRNEQHARLSSSFASSRVLISDESGAGCRTMSHSDGNIIKAAAAAAPHNVVLRSWRSLIDKSSRGIVLGFSAHHPHTHNNNKREREREKGREIKRKTRRR